MTDILVTGVSGFLGSSLAELAATSENDEVAGIYNETSVEIPCVECYSADLTTDSGIHTIGTLDPNVVVHCAALTDVDYCEEHPDKARRVNTEMAERVAARTDDIGSRLLYVSTDAVFAGESGNYAESDTPEPKNVYGQTKLAGERRVRTNCGDSVVVRTNFFGWSESGDTLAEWMVSTLRAGDELPAFTDTRFSPLYVRHLTAQLVNLFDHEFRGVLHLAGATQCSKFEFAHEVASAFDLDSDLIRRASVVDTDFSAPRGTDLSLDASRARSILGWEPPAVEEGLRSMATEEENKR